MVKITLIIHIGRRVPRSWFRRQADKLKGFLSFQENLWLIIKQSLQLAKKKANADGRLKFVMTTENENEDLNYELEWIKIIIQGTKEQEKEEYEDTLKLYNPLNKLFKQDFPVDDRMKSFFRTKILSQAKVDEAYKEGYGAIGNNNLANKLLEMGILTHVELIDDYDGRINDIKPDFGA